MGFHFRREGSSCGKLFVLPAAACRAAAKYFETPEYRKVFAVKDGEYAAHCGVWYTGGDTAYIEPVVTVPEHRRKGLGRAVVYEAVGRAKKQGAKRADRAEIWVIGRFCGGLSPEEYAQKAPQSGGQPPPTKKECPNRRAYKENPIIL